MAHYNGINVTLRRRALAELVAEGIPLMRAGESLGYTKGQTSRVWQGVRYELGAQAK